MYFAADADDAVSSALRRSSALQGASEALAERRRGERAASEAGGLRARSKSLRAGARSGGGGASAHKGSLVVRKRASASGDSTAPGPPRGGIALTADELLAESDKVWARSSGASSASMSNLEQAHVAAGGDQCLGDGQPRPGTRSNGSTSHQSSRRSSADVATAGVSAVFGEPYAPYSSAPVDGPGSADLMRECHALTDMLGIDDDWVAALCGSDSDSDDGESIWRSAGDGGVMLVC